MADDVREIEFDRESLKGKQLSTFNLQYVGLGSVKIPCAEHEDEGISIPIICMEESSNQVANIEYVSGSGRFMSRI